MKTHRCIIIIAAVYSIIIGAIYIALSVLAILARGCSIKMDGDPLLYLMYLMYFRVSTCEANINWAALGVTITDPNIPQPELPDEALSVQQTYIFALAYVILHGALIFTTFFALFGIKGSCMGRFGNYVMYFVPWIIVSVAVLALDVAATVYYIIDFINSSFDGVLMRLEIGNVELMRPHLENVPGYIWPLPSLIFFITTSKGFVLLIISIITIICISGAGWKASDYPNYVEKRRRYENSARTNLGFNGNESNVQMAETEPQLDDDQPHELRTSQNRYQDTSIHAYNISKNVPNNYQERSSSYNAHNQNQNPMRARLPDQRSTYDPRRNPRDLSVDDRLKNFQKNGETLNPSAPPIESDPPSPQFQQPQQIRPKPMVPPKPVHNRFSFQPSAPLQRTESRSSNRSNLVQQAPEELRGQLPWSYFKAPEDAPKKAFNHLDEGEELPPVPVPDYTLHFPRNKRTNLNEDSDGTWSGQEQRY